MMRTKNTYYAHLRKGKTYGRGYALGPNGHKHGAIEAIRRCLFDAWPGQTTSLRDVVARFAPVPGWPVDWERALAEAKAAWKAAA